MRRNKESIGEQREIINGKPFLGIMIGRSLIFNENQWRTPLIEAWNEDPTIISWIEKLKSFPEKFKLKDFTVIYRPAYAWRPTIKSSVVQKATLALKGILWGRAFEVFRYLQNKGSKRLKKVYRAGKRKKVKACIGSKSRLKNTGIF